MSARLAAWDGAKWRWWLLVHPTISRTVNGESVWWWSGDDCRVYRHPCNLHNLTALPVHLLI